MSKVVKLLLLPQSATNFHKVTTRSPFKDYALWPTTYELREELGEPRVVQVDEDVIGVYEPVPGHPDWVTAASFFVRDGLQLLALKIMFASRRTWPPPEVPLTTPVIRAVRIEQLYRRARGYLSIAEHVGIDIGTDATEFRKKPRPGPRGRGDRFYSRLAAKYLELVETSPTPTRDLGRAYKVSHSRARDLLHEARSRGLLTKTKQGQRGGQLTAKAHNLLIADRQAGEQSSPPRTARPGVQQGAPR